MIRRGAFLLTLLLAAAVARASEADVAAGGALYQSYCAEICHQAPAAERLGPKQWRIVLKTMQKRMQSAGMEPLSAAEIEQILAYLTQRKEQ